MMGDAADDLAHREWQENSHWHHELNPRGYKTSEDFVWTTRDGKRIKLCDMETSHIKNCIRMLERTVASRPQEDVYGSPGLDDSDAVNDAYDAEVSHNDRLEAGLRETIAIFKREIELRAPSQKPGRK